MRPGHEEPPLLQAAPALGLGDLGLLFSEELLALAEAGAQLDGAFGGQARPELVAL